jgi:vacuolar-type H+-ATPase subunit I/STV1
MMEEKQILKQLKKFRKIQAEKNWVFSTKKQILGEDFQTFPVFQFIFSSLAAISLFFLALFQFSNSALPGEPLYVFKKAKENFLAKFVKEKEPEIKIEALKNRTEELKKITKANDTKKLPKGIEELKNQAKETNKALAQTKVKPKDLKNVMTSLQNIKEVEKNLGINIESESEIEEYQKSLKNQIKLIIEDLEQRSLTQNQKEILESAKKDLEENNLESALTKVLSLNNIE